jgi:hypothetical protein
MPYKSPKNIFQEKISNIVRREKTNAGLFEHIFKLQQIFSLERFNNSVSVEPEKSAWSVLLDVYTFLGKEKFAELLAIIKGRTLSFPSEEEYQDSLITSICYYYKEVVGLNWDQIKEKIEISNLNTIKYGIKVRAFKGFIDNGTLSAIRKNKNE